MNGKAKVREGKQEGGMKLHARDSEERKPTD